nr:unnamed protein product [Spirometra erinaceieuropaei]
MRGATGRNGGRRWSRYKVDIAALSEARFPEQGQLEERDIRDDIVGQLPCLSQDANDRLKSLRLPLPAARFATILAQYLGELSAPDDNASVETQLCRLRNAVRTTALSLRGRARGQHQEWFNDNKANISNLLAEKRSLHKAYIDHWINDTNAAFSRCRRLVQKRLWEMQDTRMTRKAKKIRRYVDSKETKMYFA